LFCRYPVSFPPMKILGRKSKRQKTSLKYNIQKRVREHKRRLKKQAKKLGVTKPKKKDPGIPNSWPFKAEMLEDIERKKERKEELKEERIATAKFKAKKDRRRLAKDRRQNDEDRQASRRAKRADDVLHQQSETLRRLLQKADVFVQALDARDPQGCRCEKFEEWVQQNNKRLVFALTKSDLLTPEVAAKWAQVLGSKAPTVVTSVEAGREGVNDLVKILGRVEGSGMPEAKDVVVIGYLDTGKSSLAKAMRAEVPGATPWLSDQVARLRPDEDDENMLEVIVSKALRGKLPTAGTQGEVLSDDMVGPAAVVRHLLEKRVQGQSVMRRLRLPAFDSVETFFKTFAQDRTMLNKKGKIPSVDVIGKQFLQEIVTAPGTICLPPDGALSEGPLWAMHGTAKGAAQAIMTAQHSTLSSRPSTGPAAAALMITSAGFGPKVDIEAYEQSEMGDISDDDDMDDDGEGLEGEEEEEGEGDEEEMDADE